MIIHHMTQSQVDDLAAVFAKPEEWNGEIRFVEPQWLQVLREHAKKDQPLTQNEVDIIL